MLVDLIFLSSSVHAGSEERRSLFKVPSLAVLENNATKAKLHEVIHETF